MQLKFSKTLNHKTPTNKLHTLCVYVNSRDHGPLSMQLRHGCLDSVEWNGEMEWWNGLEWWNFDKVDGF